MSGKCRGVIRWTIDHATWEVVVRYGVPVMLASLPLLAHKIRELPWYGFILLELSVFIVGLLGIAGFIAWKSKRETKPKPKTLRPIFRFPKFAAPTRSTGCINEQDILPPGVSTSAVIIPKTLEIELVPRQDADMKTGSYHCDVKIHNLSKTENVSKVLLSLKDLKPAPSQAYSSERLDKRLPLPIDFPIQLKPRREGGNFIWANNASLFALFTLIRASNIPTVEIIGAEKKFCPFKVNTWWKDGVAHFDEYTLTIEVSAQPTHPPYSQRFRLKWVDNHEAVWASNPKGIMAFTVSKE